MLAETDARSRACYNSRVGGLPRIAGLLAVLALFLPAAASAYSWPLRPFTQPHAVRGYFNDPRILGTSLSFHFGIDVCGEDLSPVYAVEPGRAHVRGQAVTVLSQSGREFSYWHIIPAVRQRQRVARHQVIGRIVPGHGHVHFAERQGRMYVNPLRLGALAPYVDDTVPLIPALTFYSGGLPIGPDLVTGLVDVTVDAYDLSPTPLPPPPWAEARLSPAFIRWRIVQDGNVIRRWETAVDFRLDHPRPSFFSSIYAPGTFMSRPNRPGRNEFYLAHNFESSTLPDGSYRLQVEALDIQENVGRASFAFIVTNLP
jgi:hypothetical protein